MRKLTLSQYGLKYQNSRQSTWIFAQNFLTFQNLPQDLGSRDPNVLWTLATVSFWIKNCDKNIRLWPALTTSHLHMAEILLLCPLLRNNFTQYQFKSWLLMTYIELVCKLNLRERSNSNCLIFIWLNGLPPTVVISFYSGKLFTNFLYSLDKESYLTDIDGFRLT